MSKRAFLTPEVAAGGLILAPLWLFAGDDWEAIPRGVLTELLHEWNYEALPGSKTVEETVEVYQEAIARTFRQWTIPQPYYARTALLKPQSLIAYWPLWEGSGATLAKDRGANALDGTPTGHTWDSAGIGDGMTAVSLSGSGSKIDISAIVSGGFNINEGTLFLWLKPVTWKKSTAQGFIVVRRTDNRTVVRIHQQSSTGRLGFAITTNGSTWNALYTPASPGLSGLHNLAITWSLSQNKVIHYLDAVELGNTIHPGSTNEAPTEAVIGAWDNTAYLPTQGDFAHVTLWDSALSADEVAYLATI